tara:strand:- start:1840 stop:2283 length:444 start_codon:yes stop_codon:yes gene_type:complete
MESELLIPTIAVLGLTAIGVYGLLTKKIALLRWALFLWALIAIIANIGGFFQDALSTMVVVLFACQAILVAPFSSIPFDSSNKSICLDAKRMSLTIVIINLFFCSASFIDMNMGSVELTMPIRVCHGIVSAMGLMIFSRLMTWLPHF